MSIKYYHLAKDEELPEEFCAIRDEGGEPNGYVFYVPESEVARLREHIYEMAYYECQSAFETVFAERMRELGVEVDE